MTGVGVRENAFAKINLFLEVLGRLESGYHHLQSLMVFCDVGEFVDVAPSSKDSFKITGPMAPVLSQHDAQDNLVVRAASAYRKAAGINQPVAITLHKVMPVSSGIGGGSADAAAVLRALGRLFAQELSEERVSEIATELGADVPACLQSRPVLLDGVGAELRPAQLELDLPYLVLVNPMTAVSTPAVFKALNAETVTGRPPALESQWSIAKCRARSNDLFRPALKICPEIGHVIDALRHAGDAGLIRMSGSGASCFAAFGAKSEAQNVTSFLKQRYPDWWVVLSRLRLST